LLKAAEPNGLVDQLQESFDTLVGDPLRRSDDANDPAALMASGAIPKSRKAAVIEDIFRGKTEDLFVNFLLVLNDHNRLAILRPVAAMYRELRDEYHKRVRVLVRSAVPLDDEQRERVKKLTADYFHLQPVLVEQVDPELLGGVQLQVGDQLVDLSIRSRLETIKQQLIERSSHEIQRRRDRVGSH
jgi:F-type H+-transporting ATPase subunit delta